MKIYQILDPSLPYRYISALWYKRNKGATIKLLPGGALAICW